MGDLSQEANQVITNTIIQFEGVKMSVVEQLKTSLQQVIMLNDTIKLLNKENAELKKKIEELESPKKTESNYDSPA